MTYRILGIDSNEISILGPKLKVNHLESKYNRIIFVGIEFEPKIQFDRSPGRLKLKNT